MPSPETAQPSPEGSRPHVAPSGGRLPVFRGGSPAARLARRAAGGIIVADLRRAFRRVVWAGTPDALHGALAPGRPAVLVANHHYFHDSYLLWFLLARVLHRPPVVWMEKWHEAPLFGPVGVLPFPADAPGERVRTIRETARRMRADPRTGLFLYPEGHLHPPEDGLGPFRSDLPRLARLLPPEAQWWPLAVHVTWWGEDRPTAVLAASPPSATPHEAPARIAQAMAEAERLRPADLAGGRAHELLRGQASVSERWDLSALAPLFRRWT